LFLQCAANILTNLQLCTVNYETNAFFRQAPRLKPQPQVSKKAVPTTSQSKGKEQRSQQTKAKVPKQQKQKLVTNVSSQRPQSITLLNTSNNFTAGKMANAYNE